jgi:homoserine dehydrogenase
MQNWSSHSLELKDISEMENRFFVRVKGTVAGKIDEITEIFGRVEPISLPSVPGEFAFITKSMKEADFAAKAEKLADDMLGRIRVFF